MLEEKAYKIEEEYRIALLKAKKAAEDLIPYFPPTEEELQ